MLRSEYTKKGVEFFLETKVIEVTPDSMIVEKDGKTETIEADKILVSVGRKANTKKPGHRNTGHRTSPKRHKGK